MLFLFPLALSLAAAALFATGDYSLFTRILFPLLAIGALALQFAPGLRENVHFLVPLFMQLFVCGCWSVAMKME